MIKDSGDRTEFETGAKRDMHAGKGRMDLLPWYGIMEVSKHCEEGALKYGEHNVDKGIPLHSLLDSASRHLAKYMVGMDAVGQRWTDRTIRSFFLADGMMVVSKLLHMMLLENVSGMAFGVGVPMALSRGLSR